MEEVTPTTGQEQVADGASATHAPTDPRALPAIVLAGDGDDAKAVCGDSKVFLEIGGWPLVVHVILALQEVPLVSEVWVVGNAARLEASLGKTEIQERLTKPLHILPQGRNLYENAWGTYRQALAGLGNPPRDPLPAELDRRFFYLSGDLPFCFSEELTAFLTRAMDIDADYILGLVEEHSLADFLPREAGEAGIIPAYYNATEGRYRQSNLQLAKPARIGCRRVIGDLYHFRYQRKLINMLNLAWGLAHVPRGAVGLVWLFLKVHLAAYFHRRGSDSLSNWIRRFITMDKCAKAMGLGIQSSLRFAVTELGGCAIDIDTEHDYLAVRARYDEWLEAQQRRIEKSKELS